MLLMEYLTRIFPCNFAREVCYLLCVVGEVDFVEDLSAVLLDGVYLHLVWWELPRLHPTQGQQTHTVYLLIYY